ncbi:glycosyltransferase [Tenacibaculum crassostreae]|uniref:glycosyltransferase n=1 Tax=Tenacibaculum crassostreae TaxID=502683 RepID=UPI0038944082
MIFTALFYIFVGATAVQVLYYLFFSFFCFQSKKENNTNVNTPISLIVYTKNNASILADYCKDLSKQKHLNFEIVIVNNASTDDTLDILEELEKEYSNLKIVDVENTEAFWGNKKYALTLGVKAATNEHLLFTEVSSKALSQNWITEMVRNFSQEKTIVIGYQKLKRNKKSLSNILIRFHHLLSNIQAFTFVKFESPYKATNHNLAYTKSEFFKVNGFINHLNLFIGEAELFIKDAAKKSNTTYTTNVNGFVASSEQISFRKWFVQQKKETILYSLYKRKHRFLLSLFKITKFLTYSLAIFISIINWKIALPFILGYFLLQYIVVAKAASKFQEKGLVLLLPFFDICLVLFQISIFISNQISEPKHWK